MQAAYITLILFFFPWSPTCIHTLLQNQYLKQAPHMPMGSHNRFTAGDVLKAFSFSVPAA